MLKNMLKLPKEMLESKKLRVVHIPQVGKVNGFEVEVDNLYSALLLEETLGKYDAFQYYNKIKGDYSNVTFIEEYNEEEQEWEGWCSEEGIDDVEEYLQLLLEFI